MTKEEKTLKEELIGLLRENYNFRHTPLELAMLVIKKVENFIFKNTPFQDRGEHNRFLLALYRKDLKDELLRLGADSRYINDFFQPFPEERKRTSAYWQPH